MRPYYGPSIFVLVVNSLKIVRMPKHLTPEARETVRTLLLEGKRDHLAIADEVGVSLQTVRNYSSNLNNYGDILRPKVTRIGRPPIMNPEMIEVRDCLHPAEVLFIMTSAN